MYFIIIVLLFSGTKDLERRGAIRPGQRPTFSGSLLDSKITLHDDVFMDNNDNEPTLEKILKLHEEVHCMLFIHCYALYFPIKYTACISSTPYNH